MDELPDLSFEKVLSYLSLEDRLKARAVSRRWYHKINSFRVKTLCYSARSSDFIWGRSRWVSGAFTQNFISSIRFASFFDTFGQTILSSLKHLRLCDLDLCENETAFTLNSFDQLEELDIIRARLNQQDVFNLNLPMLTRLQLEKVRGNQKLTLEAPRLREAKILGCFSYQSDLSVDLVHGESVERLLVDRLAYTVVSKLKNLQYLYVPQLSRVDPTFLGSLQLKEIHTNDPEDVSMLFEQKQRSDHADLRIYLCGLLLNGPDDPAMNALRDASPDYLSSAYFGYLAENPSRMADLTPFYSFLYYSAIEDAAPNLEVDFLKRFIDLNEIVVLSPVQDIQRFLDFLKNCENIVELRFQWNQWNPSQHLFDRLPEHCNVQKLTLDRPPSDLGFLLRLKHLIHLDIDWSIDLEIVRRAFEELPALSSFKFKRAVSLGFSHSQQVTIEIVGPNRFEVSAGINVKTVSDLNAVIQFIVENEHRPRMHKAKDLK